jgi:hypothetical protein
VNFLKFLNGEEKVEIEGSLITGTEAEYGEKGAIDSGKNCYVVGVPQEDQDYEVLRVKHKPPSLLPSAHNQNNMKVALLN